MGGKPIDSTPPHKEERKGNTTVLFLVKVVEEGSRQEYCYSVDRPTREEAVRDIERVLVDHGFAVHVNPVYFGVTHHGGAKQAFVFVSELKDISLANFLLLAERLTDHSHQHRHFSPGNGGAHPPQTM